MEFGSGLDKVLKQEVAVIYGNKVRELHALEHNHFSRNVTEADSFKSLASLLDLLGERSAKAQTLPGPVTSYTKFRDSNQTIFLLSDIPSKKILGFLKTGRKRLFVHDRRGVCVECVPLCVLDFYVHEAHQRKGCGKKLFDFMLKYENINPSCLAIDFPSKKMLQFLQKHYQLKNPIFSSNNFVVYSRFFDQIFYDTLNIEKHSTIPCELSSIIQIWDTEGLIHKRKMNPLVNHSYHKPNNNNNNKNNNHYGNTITMDEQPKLNDQIHIHNKTLTNQQVNELHRTINDQIPIPMIDMKLCNNSNNNNNTLTSVYDVSKIDNGNIKLKQHLNELKPMDHHHNGVKTLGLLHNVYDNVNRSTTQKKSTSSIMTTNSEMFNYRSYELKNRSKQTYSYINAVRNHNCHTRLW
ncbi:unnamed protein product [Schistosoma guineensis]|nr:unnamed protein product [Schistosoma guineensis]